MKKIIINHNNELSKFFINNGIDALHQKLECPVDGCNGYITTAISQNNPSAAICSKCHKGIILKEVKC